MDKFTPGPWGWGYTTRNTGTGAMEGDLQLVTLMPNPRLNDRVIFTVREDWKRALDNSPDARLIAAAPKLVDALRAFCGDYESARDINGLETAYRHAISVIAEVDGANYVNPTPRI